jgi:asparagine synthase (glutamine-hydrolysing)
MCGLAGFVASPGTEPPTREALEAATDLLRHRGPDGSGLHLAAPVALGHRRLSIVDLDHGDQPTPNEDRSVWTVFNGEIWNHLELRRELERAGHEFRSRCDTEVLVHGYEEWGEGLVSRLNGMFAFAVWDARRERLLLARDRVGKKPLLLAETEHGLAFASTARALQALTGRAPALDRERVAEFLFQRYVGAPRTLLEGVNRLPPGHLATYDRTTLTVAQYWAFPEGGSEDMTAGELRELLHESVRSRLMSDVPLGVYLSGGIDSAAVLALMREAGAADVASFTIGFDDPLYDERPAARLVADRLGADHHEVVVRTADFAEALPRLAWYRDEPIAEPQEVPLLLLAELAGSHVKVVLTGDGGDELFGGYPKYRAERLLRLPTGLPRAALRAHTWVTARRRSYRQLGRAAATLAIEDPTLRWASWFRSFSAGELSALLGDDLRQSADPAALTSPLIGLLRPYSELDPGRRMLLGDLLTYLPDNMLLRGDRVSMAASVEGRMPLMDFRLLERVSRVPARRRSGVREAKKILRDAVRDLIPAELFELPKRGLPVPITDLLLQNPDDPIGRLLLSERSLDRGLFEADAVRGLVASGRRGDDVGLKLFTLTSLELWQRLHVDGDFDRPPERLEELL